MTSLDHQIQRAADLVRQATHVVALSGAGISTPSGIPDFRSPDSGLWDNADPMVVASLPAFVRDPQPFYTWFHPLLSTLLAAAPNPAHQALAELEAAGKLKAIVTQNIDDLHRKAGSNTVYELHGHVREVTCMQCQQKNREGAKFCHECAAPLPLRCPSCETPSPPGAKFCDAYATPLSRQTPVTSPAQPTQRGADAERRFHTLLPAVIGLLQSQRRVTYRTRKYIFGIDDALLHEIREELTLRRRAIEEEGRVAG